MKDLEYQSYYKGAKTSIVVNEEFINGECKDIPNRKLTKKTCEKYNYQLGVYNKQSAHIAQYYNDKGKLTWQKLRLKDKKFVAIGQAKESPLYGQWLFQARADWPIIITEGELDALSVYQAFEGLYSVVSLPYGAGPQTKSIITRESQYLLGFKEIILAFDNDESGQKAVEEVLSIKELAISGKIKIAKWPLKDANELLVAGRGIDIKKAIWEAKEYRLEGIVRSNELSEELLLKPDPMGTELPYPKLNEMIRGKKSGRLYLWTAGSGLGKTTLLKEIGMQLVKNEKIGCIFLEESIRETALSYVAIDNNIPLYRISEDPEKYRSEILATKQSLFDTNRIVFYDHFGSLDSKALIAKMNYMVTVEGCTTIFLDHITIAISGLESSEEGERKDIDVLMTRLRSLAQRTGCALFVISHLKRKEKSYNEGGTISLSDLRGSGSLEHLSDVVIGIERNQFDEDITNQGSLKVLKNRITGQVGYADTVFYNVDTGRLQ